MLKRLDLVSEVEAKTSRVDGQRWSWERFRYLDFGRAYRDGPSVFGRVYLQVPDILEPEENIWRRVSPIDPLIRRVVFESGYWFWSD